MPRRRAGRAGVVHRAGAHPLTEDAATRYRAFIAEEPAPAARLTQRQIAAYVVGSAVARDHGRYATVVPQFWIPGGPFTPERGITPQVLSVRHDRSQLPALVEQLAAGTFTAKVGAVLPLTDAARAHGIVGRAEGSPEVAGKVVLAPWS